MYALVNTDVSGGRLEVWDVPSPHHEIIGTLDPGAKFVVLGGPYCYPFPWPGDGTPDLRLWHVVTVDGTLDGWVEEYGIGIPDGLRYTIEPFPEAGTFFHYFAPTYCDEERGFLPYIGLSVGGKARVTSESAPAGLPLVDSPTWYAGQTEGSRYLPPGDVVTVLEGPYCFRALWHTTAQAAFRLWRVRSENSGLEGWTAEYWRYRLGSTHGYYLEPVNDELSADGQAQVITFTASPNPVERGGTLTLSWQVSGLDQIGITRLSESAGIYLESLWSEQYGGIFPAQGSLTYTIPDRYVEQIPFVLLNPGKGPLETLTVPIICPFAETFTDACPLTRQSTPAAFQPFENGYMVWRADTQAIYILYQNGHFEEYADTWVEGQPDVIDETPPAGYTVPQRGFGQVWGTQAAVREQLGWALGAETAYTMMVEVYPGVWNRPDTQRFTLPDGRLIDIYPYSYSWQVATP